MQLANQKHLTLEDRNYIEQALNQNITFKEIGKFLSKDSTTMSKEIKKHRTRKEASKFINGNICVNRFYYTKKNVCGKNCHPKCNSCSICIHICEFVIIIRLIVAIHSLLFFMSCLIVNIYFFQNLRQKNSWGLPTVFY